jgi:hypothetical protein
MRDPKRHVWCEEPSPEVLGRREVLDALVERAIQPIVAVTPSTRASLPGIAARLRDAGLPVAIWPMLEAGEGRWASLHTWPRFVEHTERTLEMLAREGVSPDELAIDLEPPIATMRRMLSGRMLSGRVLSGRMGRDAVAMPRARAEDVARWLDARRRDGLRLSAAVVPLTIAGSDRVARGWQRLFGTPVHGHAYDRVSAMAYSSLVEGYSRGLLQRRDAVAFVADAAIDAARALGTRASLSLGCIGRGVLGDERCYRSPAELAQDVAIARAEGIEDLALYALEGALRRGPLEEWLDALVGRGRRDATPRRTVRSRGVRALSVAIGLGAALWPTRHDTPSGRAR